RRVILSQDVTFDEDYLFRVKQDPIESKLEDSVSRYVEDVPKQVEHVVPEDMDHDDTSPDDYTNLSHFSIAHDRPRRNVFKMKTGLSGSNNVRFKARLVAKGYSQKEGIDYTEIFSVVTAFLHGDLEEKIYLSQPEGFIVQGKEDYDYSGAARKILGMKIIRDRKHKIEYMLRIPYASPAGSLMYVMVCMRPDIAHAMIVVSRYMAHPGKELWNAVKRIFHYLKGTSDVGLIFGGEREYLVGRYSDSDYVADLDARRSLTAEYMALTEAVKEGIWLKGLIEDGFPQDQATAFCDSMSAIFLAKDQVYHDRNKHIDVRYHFIRTERRIKVKKIAIKDNPADVFTNASLGSIESRNDQSGCKYAFMVDVNLFGNLADKYVAQNMPSVPAVLDWRQSGNCNSLGPSILSSNLSKTIELSAQTKVGVTEDHKRSWVKRLCNENKVNFLALQETMTGEVDRFIIRSLWSNSLFDFAFNKAMGKSGVYAPQEQRLKRKLWFELTELILNHNTLAVILGDFNEERAESELMGMVFENFFESLGLHDIPMGDPWPNSYFLADHKPLLLLNSVLDYDLSPFKFFNSWLLLEYELKSMFEKQARVKRFHQIQTFHACKQEEGKPVVEYVLRMKGYLEQLERLGYTIGELNAMLIEYEKGLPKKAATPHVMLIQCGRIQKGNKKSFKAKGKDKAKTRERINKLIFLSLKTLNLLLRSTQLRMTLANIARRKLKQGALYLYVGNGVRVQVEAIGSYDLVLPNGLVICLDSCHYAHTITRGFISVSRLVNNGFIQCSTNYGISVSKNDVLYFNAIPRDGIYEIDIHNLVPNVNYIYNVINKRVKHNLDSTYLWHYRLAHISKKHIEKLQHDGLIESTDDESFDECVSCLSGKMTRKPFSHRTERATDLLGIIHTDVCGLLRHVSRQGTSNFITFMDDYSRYGYVYLLKHKHEVFETFKVFKNEVDNQLEKTIKDLRSDRGGEYISQEFKDYLKAFRIVQQLTPLYTPQHNGVFERRNNTLLDMVRSMMNVTTLPLSFWDYAQESTTRILNVVLTKKVYKTPYELWIPKGNNGLLFLLPSENKIVVARTHRAPNRLCLNVEVEEHSLGDLNEPTSYKAVMLDLESWSFFLLIVRLLGKRFSPVADIRAIRILISIAAFYDYEIWQMDVKTAFLNGYLDEDIYMVQPEGFVDPNHPRKCFSMKDLGETTFILGIKIYKDRSKRLIGLSQNAYMDKILKRYRMDNSKRGYIPMQDRLDLNKTQGASTLEENPGEPHWTAVKNILKYLKNTKDMFLVYGGNPGVELRVDCYCDAGFETDRDDTKDKIIYDLDKTPDLSQRPPQNYPKCGNPVDDSSEPSNDNTNIVNALQEPFVSNQDPDKTFSHSPPQINHHCCYGCSDLLEDIFFHQCTYELSVRGAHYGYNCPSKVPVVPNSEPFNNQTIDELPQTLPSFNPTCYCEDGNSFTYDSTSNIVHYSPNVFSPPLQPPTYSYEFCRNDAYYGYDCSLQTILEIELAFEDKHFQPEDILDLFRILHNDVQNIHEELVVYINTLNWDRPTISYDDDDDEEDYAIAVIPSLLTEEPDNSLSMGDEHLDTIPATESDEFIKFSVESLVPIPSEYKGIPDNMCDMPFHDNSPPLDVSKDQFEDFSNSNDDSTSNDDHSFSIDNIKYVEASPLDSKLISSEVMEIIISKVGGIDDDILLTIKDEILREKLLNVNIVIANIKALNDNPTPSSDFMTKSSSTFLNSLLEETNIFDNSVPEFEIFFFDLEEISSGSTTTHSDISLPEYKTFYDDHVKEISSGSTTTHSDSSLYDSFIYDLLINPFPLADRSDFMSSSMNSLTSYIHQSMIVSALKMNPTRGISLWMWWRILF
nr:hypothetical protein [Tanacetum cinerariifolium]